MTDTEPTLSTLAAERRAASEDAMVLAVQRQHEEDLRKLREEHSKRIEGFALDVLDSYLDGADWEAAFASFFRRNAPFFAEFDAARGFDLQMTEVHKTFLSTLDGLLDTQLARMDISAQRCAELLDGGGEATGALAAVRTKLTRYTDFLTFGQVSYSRTHAHESQRTNTNT